MPTWGAVERREWNTIAAQQLWVAGGFATRGELLGQPSLWPRQLIPRTSLNGANYGEITQIDARYGTMKQWTVVTIGA